MRHHPSTLDGPSPYATGLYTMASELTGCPDAQTMRALEAWAFDPAAAAAVAEFGDAVLWRHPRLRISRLWRDGRGLERHLRRRMNTRRAMRLADPDLNPSLARAARWPLMDHVFRLVARVARLTQAQQLLELEAGAGAGDPARAEVLRAVLRDYRSLYVAVLGLLHIHLELWREAEPPSPTEARCLGLVPEDVVGPPAEWGDVVAEWDSDMEDDVADMLLSLA